MELDSLIEKIKNNKIFLKLKDIEENNSYHDHQKTFDHLVLTCDKAKETVKGDFIENPEAKENFLKFMNEEIYGMKRADVLMLVGLLHDIGKILWFREGESKLPLEFKEGDLTFYPGHEYWGSTIVKDVLAELNLNEELVKYISKCVELHGEFSDPYLKPKEDWDFDKLLNDVKARCGGLYKESLFNQYCDCIYAKPFEYGISMITKLLNSPELYISREYYIP